MLGIFPADIDALIVTNSYNIFYLAGFKGISETEQEAILVIKGGKSIESIKGIEGKTLITARLYQAEANKLKSPSLEIKIASERDQIMKHIFEALKGTQKIGFEQNDLTVSQFNKFKDLLPGRDLIATENLVENMRVIKTGAEIKKIEKAQIISQKALESLLPTIEIGQTEAEIAQRLESIMRNLGSQGSSFGTIVASGPHSGIPHHFTGTRKIKKGDTLLFDFGAKYQNYCADLTRTVFIGKPSDRQANIYNHVARTQKAAIAKITHGMKTHEPFQTASDIFKEKSLEKYFLHGLGHGIGLEVHEKPYLRKLSTTNNELLTNNMVFSVEPGLYFPWGGVRIEDLVVIQNGQGKVLGKMEKELIII